MSQKQGWAPAWDACRMESRDTVPGGRSGSQDDPSSKTGKGPFTLEHRPGTGRGFWGVAGRGRVRRQSRGGERRVGSLPGFCVRPRGEKVAQALP